MRRTLLAAVLLAALPACHTRYTTLSGNLRLGATAEENYQHGVDEMKDKNYAEALRFFEYVKAKYPFSALSAQSELRGADIKYNQGRYLEAAGAYEAFSKDHPSSEEIDYAQHRAALSHLEAAPGDFALFPASYEKDLRQARMAADGAKDFLAKRPDSKYAPDERQVLARAEQRLGDHDWYVAEFYYKRGYWAGAASRYRELVDSFPGAEHERDAYLKLAHAYVKMNEKFQARQALQQLIAKHPDGPERPEAEKLLESLR